MPDLTFTAGDTAPSIDGVLSVGGQVLDLTSAVGVRFRMRPLLDRRFSVDGEAVVVAASTGVVRYDLEPNDLAEPGDYIARWLVIWNDDTQQYTEPENTIRIDPA